MQSINKPISKLKANSGQIPGLPKNPRVIRDERFQKLVQSIKEDPEMLSLRELIVFPYEGNYVVIAGNMRLKAMHDLGYKECPVKVLPEDTPPEKLRAYAIKDNVAFGDTDWGVIEAEWDAGELEEWGLDVPYLATDIDLDSFFEESNTDEKDSLHKITLEYTEQDYNAVQEALKQHSGSKEQIFFKLLGLSKIP